MIEEIKWLLGLILATQWALIMLDARKQAAQTIRDNREAEARKIFLDNIARTRAEFFEDVAHAAETADRIDVSLDAIKEIEGRYSA